MNNPANIPEKPKQDQAKNPEPPTNKGVERIANEAAEKAQKSEQKYDEDHNIFTK
ncbi:MAG TPA: hypothetical protein VM554_12610 [Acidisarcina sp.]|nr:hypothetical protein [Acidisarcina sp.]